MIIDDTQTVHDLARLAAQGGMLCLVSAVANRALLFIADATESAGQRVRGIDPEGLIVWADREQMNCPRYAGTKWSRARWPARDFIYNASMFLYCLSYLPAVIGGALFFLAGLALGMFH